MSQDYKAAYERQKKARELAEEALEKKSRELYDSHQSLMTAYTRLKDQKEQLLHQEKLASIGQLSAGIAHEINNPTGFVSSNLSSLAEYIGTFKKAIQIYSCFVEAGCYQGDDIELVKKSIDALDTEFVLEDVDDLISDSKEGVHRIKSIVESLNSFARPDSKEAKSVDLHECITNTVKLVESAIKFKAELKLELKGRPFVKGRVGELSQVFLNLLTNAADAIEEHGEITVKTSIVDASVKISVTDTGTGIDAADLTKIFDPFFSTKDIGKGTGLGLSISHGIIRKHSGILSVASEPQKGTTFTIELPLKLDSAIE